MVPFATLPDIIFVPRRSYSVLRGTRLLRREGMCRGIIATDMQRLTALGVRNKERRTENIEPKIENRKPQIVYL
jgi:hypothetical protein